MTERKNRMNVVQKNMRMSRNERNVIILGICFLFLFIFITIGIFIRSNDLITQGYLKSEGEAAENFAVLTASNIHLTDEDVERLKIMNYKELLESEENENLRKMMDNDNFATVVDYAYVMVHLPDEEVRYYVSEENREFYQKPEGTAFDILWLLDVNVSEEAKQNANEYYESQIDELNRFSCFIEEDEFIFDTAPTYIYQSNGWGEHICGYAPLYTEEGNYIGVLGVDLHVSNFEYYRNTAMFALGMLIATLSITLLSFFFVLYYKYRKLQYDKIYTDPLTQMCNRSYYNNQFIKVMNQRVKNKKGFGLMIVDIDWFKTVNDTFGHEIGDEVLIEMGQIFISIFDKNSTVRFGGEEFVMGYWYKNEEELFAKIEELFTIVRSHKFSKQLIPLTISLGCCLKDCHELNGWLISDMLKLADDNLYIAKENGRNQYLCKKDETPIKK